MSFVRLDELISLPTMAEESAMTQICLELSVETVKTHKYRIRRTGFQPAQKNTNMKIIAQAQDKPLSFRFFKMN